MDSKQLVNDIVNKKFSKARDTIREELVNRIIAKVESMGPETGPEAIHEALGILKKAVAIAGGAGLLGKGVKSLKKRFGKKGREAARKKKSEKLASTKEKNKQKAAESAMKVLLKMRKDRDQSPEDSDEWEKKQEEINAKEKEYISAEIRIKPRPDETRFMTKGEKRQSKAEVSGKSDIAKAKAIKKGDKTEPADDGKPEPKPEPKPAEKTDDDKEEKEKKRREKAVKTLEKNLEKEKEKNTMATLTNKDPNMDAETKAQDELNTAKEKLAELEPPEEEEEGEKE